MPDIEARLHAAWNHVARTGTRFYSSDGRDEPWRRASVLLNSRNPLSRCGQRVTAKVHGCSSRMVRLAFEDHAESALTHNRVHHRQRQAQAFEHGSLLDVKLDVAQRLACDLSV